MVGKTKRATADEARRMTVLKENVPCLCCLIDTARIRLPTIQHVTRGRKRLGHGFTYPSCEWHHLALPPDVGGPSLADGRKPFEAHYGPEEFLVRMADYCLDQYDESPWIDYNVPTSVIAALQEAHRVKTTSSDTWLTQSHDGVKSTRLLC